MDTQRLRTIFFDSSVQERAQAWDAAKECIAASSNEEERHQIGDAMAGELARKGVNTAVFWAALQLLLTK